MALSRLLPTARGGAAPKGLIVGRVVDAVSNTPIPSVIVTLAGASLGSSIRVLTDSQGRFLYRNVPSGSFTLRAAIGANVEGGGFLWAGGLGPQVGPYLNGGYGQRRPGGLVQSLDLAVDEQMDEVVIKLWQGGSIDGRVFDEAGEPLVDVVVAAPRLSVDGRLQNGPTVRTDDRVEGTSARVGQPRADRPVWCGGHCVIRGGRHRGDRLRHHHDIVTGERKVQDFRIR